MDLPKRDPKKKCITKKCEDCHFYRHWKMVHDRGAERIELICSLDVVFMEIPKLIGSIDGVQEASNETRNTVLKFGQASATAFKEIADNLNRDRLIEHGND